MKKNLAFLFFCLSMAWPVYAIDWNDENCTNRGGTIKYGNKGTFCQSKKNMNWWSANTWCQQHGGKLASVASVCASDVVAVNLQCNSGWSGNHRWTSTTSPGDEGTAWVICQADNLCGPIQRSKTKTSVNLFALCE